MVTAPMVMHALRLARAGRAVIEMHPEGKRPLGNRWPDRATTDPVEIGRRWEASPHANIGYTLDQLVAIDIDTVDGHGHDGPATWAALTAGRSVPQTWTVRTPTGGLHLVLALPDEMVVTSTPGGLGDGVDVKSGPAACLVGPGSRTARGAYVLLDDAPPAPLPGWLGDELIRAGLVGRGASAPTTTTGTGETFAAPATPWEPLGRFGEPIPQGQRAAVMYRYACSMRARRFSRAEAEGELSRRFRDCVQPPGDPFTSAEALAALDSAWKHPSGSADATTEASGGKGTASGPPAADPVMFHGLLGEMVHAAGPHTEADPVGVLVSLLAGVGAIIGGGVHLQVGSTRHPLLVWPLLFGHTGSGRKGEAGHTAKLFLHSSYPEGDALMVSGLSSGEGLIERIRDTNAANENDKGGHEDKRLLITEPEFATVMARAKREGSTLAGVLREAWDGGALSVLNRDAITASASHVAIVGHVTPAEFRLRLAESDMSGGTYNRFLPVYVERSKRLPLPEPMPTAVVDALGARLRDAIGHGRWPGTPLITLTSSARDRWVHGVYDELTASNDEDAAWSEFTQRAAPYCLRIAALHAVLDGRTKIDEEHLVAALALVRYSIDSAKYVLAGRSRNARLDTIRRNIDGSKNGLTRTEISGLFSRNVTAATLDELLAALVADGTYSMTSVPTGGRPADTYRRATP